MDNFKQTGISLAHGNYLNINLDTLQNAKKRKNTNSTNEASSRGVKQAYFTAPTSDSLDNQYRNLSDINNFAKQA